MAAVTKATTSRATARREAESCSLAEKKCVPCEGGVAALGAREVARLAREVPSWTVVRGRRLRRRLDFDDFVALMDFVNAMALLAEDEGHHPDFSVHYARLDVELWTHAVGGLSENDFVLAAKLDRLLGSPSSPRRPRRRRARRSS